jgi:hypothetical protein
VDRRRRARADQGRRCAPPHRLTPQAAPGTQHPGSWRRSVPRMSGPQATRQRTTAEDGTAAGPGGLARGARAGHRAAHR